MDLIRVVCEYMPPPALWPLAIVAVGVFVLVAERGAGRGRRHPIVLAVTTAAVTLTAIVEIISFLHDREGFSATTSAQFALGAAATLIGSFFFLGIAAIGFRGLRSAPRRWRAAGSFLAGLLAFPVGLLITLYAACMFGLGCI